jgi:NADH-quinone oxidoreductase subunit H
VIDWLISFLNHPVIAAAIKGGFLVGVLLSITGFLVLIERKVIAYLQHRVGPNRAGPFGLCQPFADVFKLLTKEDFTPPFVDKVLFIAAPMIITITGLMGLAIIPFGDVDKSPWYVVSDTNLGVLVFLALSSLGVYSIVLAGWSSNNKYSTLGGLRATAQMISYELAMGLSLLSVVVMAGSMNLNDIVVAQKGAWFVFLQPIGFFVFLVAIVAESRRTPFDLPEAENELVAGFHTEYSSLKFALFFLGEYVGVVVLSAIMAVMYLGGWQGPVPSFLPEFLQAIVPAFWLIFKIACIFFFFIWIRATFPRFRYDQLMDIGWKRLIPLALINLLISTVISLLFLQGTGGN